MSALKIGCVNICNKLPTITTSRNFWGMLNQVFNRPDHERIKEVGPDRACAEWLLRCGVLIRWKDAQTFHSDYNSLPGPADYKKFKIEEVIADEAAVMAVGFEHFEGCEHIKKMRFHHCPYLEDSAAVELLRLKNSLQHLEITSCGDLSENGLISFKDLQKLEYLKLFDLPNVRNPASLLEKLKTALPDCKIDYKDAEKTKR